MPGMVRPSRRLVLRGAGVALALPWLEAHAATPPKRLAVLFMGNGINANHWWARGAGAQMQLGKSLQPMERLKAKMNFIGGLFNKPSTGVGIHPGMTGGILSGAPLQKGPVLKGGVSMDQVLAERLGQETTQPSLVLGCEQPNTGYHESNFSMAYSSHISWQTPDAPVPLEVYPSLAFDSLFENRGGKRLRSLLDAVKEDAAGLGQRVARTDRAKVDEFLTSVREVEKRLEPLRPAQPAPAGTPRPPAGLPADLREHMKLMCDVVALAFQTDRTRVATLMLCRDLSGLFYPFLDVRDAHHPASHRDLSDDYERVSRYYCGQLAYLAQRLDDMPEGDGTVLDHSCLLFLSNMYSGWKHDNTRLPVLTVGGLGGTLATGRVMDHYQQPDEQRRVCSLYLSLMDRLGVTLDRFGDADNRLTGL
jgi:hypothetical protein